MYQKILIANRGEIAVRIIRACREMGIASVAVCSEADKEALHAQLADECICIGPARPKDSYLNMEQILSAALVTGAQAIHPGFGFLSENTKFARMCMQCGIDFIGPSPESMEKMGDKAEARKTMIRAGVPVIPGTKEEFTDVEEAKKKRIVLAILLLLRLQSEVGEEVCELCKVSANSAIYLQLLRMKRCRHLVITECTLKNILYQRGILKYRF